MGITWRVRENHVCAERVRLRAHGPEVEGSKRQRRGGRPSWVFPDGARKIESRLYVRDPRSRQSHKFDENRRDREGKRERER